MYTSGEIMSIGKLIMVSAQFIGLRKIKTSVNEWFLTSYCLRRTKINIRRK